MRLHSRSLLFTSTSLMAWIASSAFAQTATPAVRSPIVPLAAQADVKTILVEPVKPLVEPNQRLAVPFAERDAKMDVRTPRSKSRVPSERVVHALREGGTLWVRGDAYKASFDASGATYIPDFGPRAPRNFETKLVLASVKVDGAELAFSTATPTRAADRIVYDRGTLREVYDLAPNTVEQSFVFDSLPTRGDLEVRVNVASDLPRGQHEGRLALESDLGRIDISNAIAIDANGARTELETAWNADAIVLRVPAEFVRNARFPLVVDPVLSTSTPSGGTTLDYLPDVSYDAVSGLTAYVWETPFSASDSDIAVEFVGAGGVVTFQNYIDFTSANWRHPSMAYNRFVTTFFVAAEVGAAPNRSIGVQSVSAAGVFGSAFYPSTGVTGDHLLPDVGGDFFNGSATSICIVWERDVSVNDTDILARVYDEVSAPITGVLYIANSVNSLDRHPSISKGAGEGANSFQGWNIVYDHAYSPTDRDTWGARIKFNGNVISAAFAVDTSSRDDAYPSVTSSFSPAGLGEEWYAVAQRYIGPNDRDLVAMHVVNDVPDFDTNLSAFDPAFLGENQIAAAAETDGKQLIVAFMESYQGSTTDTDIYVSEYAVSGGTLVPSETHVNLAFNSSAEQWPQIATTRTSGVDGNCARIVWADDNFGDSNIIAASYCGLMGGPVSTFCAGDVNTGGCPCGNFGAAGHGCANSVNSAGSVLAFGGSASVLSDNLVLTSSGMPNSATCLFYQGTIAGNGAPFGDGKRCASGTIIRLGTKTCVGGMASYPQGADVAIHTRGLIPDQGATRYYQVWYRNPAVFCTGSTYNLSNGLSVVWVR